MTDSLQSLCSDLIDKWDNAEGNQDLCGVANSLDLIRAAIARPEPKIEKIGLDVIRKAIEERDDIEQRYYDLAQNMVYEGNSVSHWCNKARAYENTVSGVWEELKKAEINPDGRKSCVDGVRELAERCSGKEDLNEEKIAKVIYRESYYAFGFDSLPPKWEELGDCLVRRCCIDFARAIMTRWYHNLKVRENKDFDITPEHSSRYREENLHPEVKAAYDYVHKVSHTSDSVSPQGGLAWHGWALREAFLAGCSYSTHLHPEPTPPTLKEISDWIISEEKNGAKWATAIHHIDALPVAFAAIHAFFATLTPHPYQSP